MKIPSLNKEAWLFIVLTFLSLVILFKFVNIEPHIDNNFFFSNDDSQFQDEKLISRSFVRKDTLLIINAQGTTDSSEYLQRIRTLSESLLKVPGVKSVKSISQGPGNLQKALKSPLWKRLLISKDQQSTNIVVFLPEKTSSRTIPEIEELISKSSTKDFSLILSGPPYIIELVGRYLLKDIRIFSILALIIFGLVIFFIFRSIGILVGTIITCMNASMLSLMAVHMLGIKIGLLTANLATIVFVLTLSHIVFLTYNWKYVCSQQPLAKSPVEDAIRLTFSPSFWCMSTALLGFFSLLSVPAQPLKELGAAGIAGSVIALSVAYGIYPSFLRMVNVSSSKNNKLDHYEEKIGQYLEQKKKLVIIFIFILFLVALPGLWKVNTDPSLISYFNKNSEIEKGLTYIDHHGGSSPLIFVVKRTDGKELDTDIAYHQLWKLQRSLEQQPDVGTVLSLPIIMKESKQSLIASFISWKNILNILKQSQFDGIARSFITDDHKQGLFLLRMNESDRKISRLEVIEKLKKIVSDHGFTPALIGGVYSLQGHLSKLVASSLIFGLIQLILIFSIIAWVVSRSFGTALAITLSICVIPVIVLGMIGWLKIPLDIVSSPASNIAIGLGIDSMIHMARAYQRQKDQKKTTGEIWKEIRHRFWQPVLTFTLIMTLGFGIFIFSEFPSTQRFGIAIVCGALITFLTALFVMPSLAQIRAGAKKP